MRTKKEWQEIKASGSRCTCGHIGDKINSEHNDTMAYGHGDCQKCDCLKFTWAGFIADEKRRAEGSNLK